MKSIMAVLVIFASVLTLSAARSVRRNLEKEIEPSRVGHAPGDLISSSSQVPARASTSPGNKVG